ncbi:MAG TPA: tetratricopeptide repeat protein [Rhodocyclaceae bacterium]|nr:tetratricopeptide repeat protein [Rhodocyclaceae bacterium]HNH12822.1 tetratricopeptide repeat protein [Rhodocyclaceae bacterium]
MSVRTSPERIDQLVALLNAGQFDQLERAASDCARDHPAEGRAWQLLGVSHLVRGRHRDAVATLLRAVSLMPENASVHENLGLAYCHLGDHVSADGCLANATRMQPAAFSAWVNWSHSALQSGDAGKAEDCARRALALHPRSAAAHLNLGKALAAQSRWAEAEAGFRAALELKPAWVEGGLGLGSLFESTGRLRDAAACYEGLTATAADDWRVFTNLGRVRSVLGDTASARDCYARAAGLNPQNYAAYSGYLFHLLHDAAAEPAAIFAEHCRYGERVDAAFCGRIARHANVPDRARRLRIGFVSGDFRNHAVAFFIEPMFEALGRRKLDIVAYSNFPDEDAVTQRLKALVDVWHGVAGVGDDALAQRIRADGIDILVDLSGHSACNRLPVFARKPAPVQVTWLGYSGTTGMRSMDYRFVYRHTAPPGWLDDQFTENLVYLPCAMSFETSRDAPEVGPLPASVRGQVTFASLNRPNKISDRAIALWARVLHALPTSRLLIGAINDVDTAQRLLDMFARCGIEPARIELRPRLPLRDYLELHNEIDILLDTVPYAGGTTTNHALWMGVPTVTLAGRTLPQRLGAGIMNKVGLPEWVADSEDEFVAIARRAAADPARLAVLRADLRQRLTHDPNLRTEKVADCVARAFRIMWHRWCDGLTPEPIELQA